MSGVYSGYRVVTPFSEKLYTIVPKTRESRLWIVQSRLVERMVSNRALQTVAEICSIYPLPWDVCSTAAKMAGRVRKPCIALGVAAIIQSYPEYIIYSYCRERGLVGEPYNRWGGRVLSTANRLVKAGVLRSFTVRNMRRYVGLLAGFLARMNNVPEDRLAYWLARVLRVLDRLSCRPIALAAAIVALAGGLSMGSTARRVGVGQASVRKCARKVVELVGGGI